MWKQLLQGLRMTLVVTALTGLIYPGTLTGLCQLLFPAAANGSLIMKAGKPVGSFLIGQNFTRSEYFHPRPSAAEVDGYDGAASSGSNLGPTSQKLSDRVKASVAAFRQENPDFAGSLPADAATASGSGLDPHISPASAQAQVARVAKARSLNIADVQRLVDRNTEGRDLGFLGEPRVNVLRLNLALDELHPR